MKLKLGYCGVCDEIQIWYKDREKGLVFTDQYAEFSMKLSDDTLARHGICKLCIVKLDDQAVAAVFERIKESWAEQYVGWASNSQFATMRALTVKSWSTALDMDQDAEDKHKVIKEREFKEKIDKSKADKKTKGDDDVTQ